MFDIYYVCVPEKERCLKGQRRYSYKDDSEFALFFSVHWLKSVFIIVVCAFYVSVSCICHNVAY